MKHLLALAIENNKISAEAGQKEKGMDFSIVIRCWKTSAGAGMGTIELGKSCVYRETLHRSYRWS